MPKDTKSRPSALPRFAAVALHYEKELRQAPKVVAKAKGERARQLVEIAKEHGVPVTQDETLAASLHRVDLDAEIPVELYDAVARILAWLQQTDINPSQNRK